MRGNALHRGGLIFEVSTAPSAGKTIKIYAVAIDPAVRVRPSKVN